MSSHQPRFKQFRSIIGPIERAVQANIALVIAQALVIRLSLEIQKSSDREPDLLVLLGFLLTCALTIAIAVILYRLIRTMPWRIARILTAIASLAIQATAFQVIFSLVT